jgi:hypothetical protein
MLRYSWMTMNADNFAFGIPDSSIPGGAVGHLTGITKQQLEWIERRVKKWELSGSFVATLDPPYTEMQTTDFAGTWDVGTIIGGDEVTLMRERSPDIVGPSYSGVVVDRAAGLVDLTLSATTNGTYDDDDGMGEHTFSEGNTDSEAMFFLAAVPATVATIHPITGVAGPSNTWSGAGVGSIYFYLRVNGAYYRSADRDLPMTPPPSSIRPFADSGLGRGLGEGSFEGTTPDTFKMVGSGTMGAFELTPTEWWSYSGRYSTSTGLEL